MLRMLLVVFFIAAFTRTHFSYNHSPNVYRTPSEALQAFNWFDQVANWEEHFSTWERYLVIYVGALAMWIIGKRLKKRHGLKGIGEDGFYVQTYYMLQAS